MTAMICPMLSALKPVDDAGRPVNRECIYEQCRFFNRDQRDCNLMLGTRAATHLAGRAAAGPQAGETERLVRESGQALLDRVASLESTITQLAGVLARLETQVAAIIDVQEKVADRLLEEMSLIQMSAEKTQQSVGGLEPKIAGAVEGQRTVLQALETRLRRDQEEIAGRHRDEAVACNNRGVALYYRGAFEAAAEAFRRALELTPDYAEACNNLGLVLSKLGRQQEAIDAFRKALTVDPKMGEAYNNLGFQYHTAAQYERAAEMFSQAIENAADSSVAYTNLGNTFYAMQQHEKAVAAWRRAVDLDPLNESARRGLRMFEQEAGAN